MCSSERVFTFFLNTVELQIIVCELKQMRSPKEITQMELRRWNVHSGYIYSTKYRLMTGNFASHSRSIQSKRKFRVSSPLMSAGNKSYFSGKAVSLLHTGFTNDKSHYFGTGTDCSKYG